MITPGSCTTFNLAATGLLVLSAKRALLHLYRLHGVVVFFSRSAVATSIIRQTIGYLPDITSLSPCWSPQLALSPHPRQSFATLDPGHSSIRASSWPTNISPGIVASSRRLPSSKPLPSPRRLPVQLPASHFPQSTSYIHGLTALSFLL